MATGVRMAKTFSVLRAPSESPSRSMIQSSSKVRRITSRIPTNPGPRRYDEAVMNETIPGPAVLSKTFQSAQRQKYT